LFHLASASSNRLFGIPQKITDATNTSQMW
jgi:hypothetical protein